MNVWDEMDTLGRLRAVSDALEADDSCIMSCAVDDGIGEIERLRREVAEAWSAMRKVREVAGARSYERSFEDQANAIVARLSLMKQGN